MKELTIEATIDNLNEVLAFVTEDLEEMECPMRTQMAIEVSVEELYVNVCHYAYAPEQGMVTILTEVSGDPAQLSVTFIDAGKAFDPLAKDDPDLTVSMEKRQIGGLGIYMVKKSMDDFTYERRDGKNVVTITKVFG